MQSLFPSKVSLGFLPFVYMCMVTFCYQFLYVEVSPSLPYPSDWLNLVSVMLQSPKRLLFYSPVLLK